MKWSYSFNPGNSERDLVRFLTGDIDERNPLLYDGEVDYVITQNPDSILLAALRAAEAMRARLAQLIDESVGQISYSFSQRKNGLELVIDDLRRRIMLSSSTPYAGGIDIADKLATEQGAGRVRPLFSIRTGYTPSLNAGDELQYPEELRG